MLPTRETRPLTRPRRSRFMPHPQESSQAGAGSAAGASSQPQELHPMLPIRDTRPLTRPRRSRFIPHPQASSQAGFSSSQPLSQQREKSPRENSLQPQSSASSQAGSGSGSAQASSLQQPLNTLANIALTRPPPQPSSHVSTTCSSHSGLHPHPLNNRPGRPMWRLILIPLPQHGSGVSQHVGAASHSPHPLFPSMRPKRSALLSLQIMATHKSVKAANLIFIETRLLEFFRAIYSTKPTQR